MRRDAERACEAAAAIDNAVQRRLAVVHDPVKLDERGCRDAPDWLVDALLRARAAYGRIVKHPIADVPESTGCQTVGVVTAD